MIMTMTMVMETIHGIIVDNLITLQTHKTSPLPNREGFLIFASHYATTIQQLDGSFRPR